MIRFLFLFFLLMLPLSVRATPSLVVDAATLDILHAEDAGDAWYPASTTKLMTAFVVFEELRAGRISLDTDIVFSRNALAKETLGSSLTPGSVMSLEEALSAMLGVSANSAAVAIAETVAGDEMRFVETMNDAARRLQMTGTHFTNPEGLFDRAQVSTARDLAILGIAIDRTFPEYLPFFGLSEVHINGERLTSNNHLLTRFPGTLGLKTGFICASGRNLVSLAERDGRRFVAVILGATTDRERNERTAGLLKAAFDRSLNPTGQTLPDLPNDPASKPEDMRVRLCSPRTAAYELRREQLYPMGLPGHASYLEAPGPPAVRMIHTRAAPLATSIPLPVPAPRGNAP